VAASFAFPVFDVAQSVLTRRSFSCAGVIKVRGKACAAAGCAAVGGRRTVPFWRCGHTGRSSSQSPDAGQRPAAGRDSGLERLVLGPL